MTSDPSQARKPYDAAPYASLRSPEGPSAGQAGSNSVKEASPNEFLSEAERLRALREALWSAFEAGPAAGLPNTLIDLTMAYTNALRLQLNLRSVAVRQPKVRAVPRSEAAKG